MNKKIYCFYKVENNVMLNKISYKEVCTVNIRK